MMDRVLMIEVHTTRYVLIICLSGEIDIATAPALSAALTTAASGDWRLIAVDCTALRFIDVAGTRPLAIGRQAAIEQGLSFLILDPCPNVARVLALFDLQEVIVPGERLVARESQHAQPIGNAPRVVDLSSSRVLAGVGRRYLDLPTSR
jgi:anti-anti-sigma factor